MELTKQKILIVFILITVILVVGCRSNEEPFAKKAALSKDVGLCEEAEEMNKDWCFLNVAINTRNEELCGNIGRTSTRDQCYFSIARYKLDETICEKVEIENSSYGCYSGVAILKKDKSICEKAGHLKEHCYNNIK